MIFFIRKSILNTCSFSRVCWCIALIIIVSVRQLIEQKINIRTLSIKDNPKTNVYGSTTTHRECPRSPVEQTNQNVSGPKPNERQYLMVSDQISYNVEDSVFGKDITENEDWNGNKVRSDKVTHIGFLKVHKAGSTMMQNIFFRFGLRNNLTFVLPKSGNYVLDPDDVLPIREDTHRDILACHSVYSSQIFNELLPSDSVNIGIIREPLDRMISAAYYYRDILRKPYLVKIPKENFIANLINNSSTFDTEPFSKTKNSMGKNFGFSPDVKYGDTDLISKELTKLKQNFTFVLIMEEIDESLVLMKRLLNWQLSDIIYKQSNSHTHAKETLDAATVAKFKEINFLDQALYETFYEIFKSKVNEAGLDLKDEVKHYKSIVERVNEFCQCAETGDQLRVTESKWNEPFLVTYNDCQFIATKEMEFISFLRVRHQKMHSK